MTESSKGGRRLRRRLSGSILVALALMATALSGTAHAAGSISGHVSDLDEEPIAGVKVCAVSETGFEEVEERCVFTGADGGYAVPQLSAGEYAVEFLSGAAGLNYVYEAWDNQPLPFLADPVAVADAAVGGIDAELAEGGVMSGRVVDGSSGSPVPGVEVCAEPTGLENVTGCATTNLAGDYAIAGLSSDVYSVLFFPPEELEYLEQYFDDEPGLLSADPVRVTAGEVTRDVSAALHRSGWITGTIFDAVTRAPVAGTTACTFETGGSEYLGECGEADATGRYEIDRVPPGVYHVHFFSPEGFSPQWYRCANGPESALPVTVAPWVETPGVDAALTYSRTGELSQCEAALAPPPSPFLSPQQQPQRCKKGFKRKLVAGRTRCVRVKRKVWRSGGVAIASAIPLR